jgi:uncharacterized repeat protein (TIGR03803 family)
LLFRSVPTVKAKQSGVSGTIENYCLRLRWASLLLVFLSATLVAGQTFTVLHAFQAMADGATPFGGVIVDQTGNLYGTTFSGGRYNYGTIYKIDPTGKMIVLHQFTKHDGCESVSRLLLEGGGNLYGTAMQCGSGKFGTVFKLSKSGKMTVLHAFLGIDGSDPWAGLISDPAGNLYGSTTYNGPGSNGTVFQLDRRTGAETILASFALPESAQPQAPLIRDEQGNLYGTTTLGGLGGGDGYGTVFKLDPLGVETVLWAFSGGSGGANPAGGLIRDSAGNLYGTTIFGGLGVGNGGFGTIFELDTNGTLTILHNFGSFYGDGSMPYAGLISDRDGNLYGTTEYGGTWGDGSVFKLDPSGNLTILYSFTGGLDGQAPFAPLAMDSAGNLYGTTTSGGAAGEWGTVFKISP